MLIDLLKRAEPHIPVLTLVALVIAVGAIDRTFFAPSTLLVLMSDTMTLFLMASGATLVILMGGIDLSIQSVASLTSVIVAALVPEWGWFAIVAAVAGGCLAGSIGGLAHTRLKIPSFIATLAVSGLVVSAAFVISNARSIDIAAANRAAYFDWMVGETAGIPHEIFIGLAVLLALSFVERRTVFGRLVRAIGSGERAVIASGINADRVKLLAFTLSGALAGFAGVVMAGRIASGSPTLANEFLLPAIAAIIVGGTALTGGVGSVWRTFVGALIIAVVRIGMTFVGVSVFAQQIVFGVVLVAAVAATMDRSKVSIVK
ncbi:MAG TPA: ABC transporter permease [Methylomirabilota bacterium]|nr:ABC transporter permease [Methylomirabilota bacterium]